MNNKTEVRVGGEAGFLGLLGVVLVTLKLLGITAVASWSWWWVTAPFWGGSAIALCVLLVIALVAIFSK